MSSEETGSDSGSESEVATKDKVFFTRPLVWRSQQCNNLMESLDRKILRRRSDRAKEMCRKRRVGQPSARPMPQSQPDWAIID